MQLLCKRNSDEPSQPTAKNSEMKDIEPNNHRSKSICSIIHDELIYLLWSGARCDSQENIDRLIRYKWPQFIGEIIATSTEGEAKYECPLCKAVVIKTTKSIKN